VDLDGVGAHPTRGEAFHGGDKAEPIRVLLNGDVRFLLDGDVRVGSEWEPKRLGKNVREAPQLLRVNSNHGATLDGDGVPLRGRVDPHGTQTMRLRKEDDMRRVPTVAREE
jgi:hypothetical protein